VRDAKSAAGLVGMGLRFMLLAAVGMALMGLLEDPTPVLSGGRLWRPRMGDSLFVSESGSVTSATECRLV